MKRQSGRYGSHQGMMRSNSYDPQRFHQTQAVSQLQAATTQVPLGAGWSLGNNNASTTNLSKGNHRGFGSSSMGRSGSSTQLWRSSGSGHHQHHQRSSSGKFAKGGHPSIYNSTLRNSHKDIHSSHGSTAVASQQNNRPQKPKIIFLDVDGVLHSIRVARQEQLFNPQKMALLRKIIQNTDAVIVLSSAWRRTAPTLRMAYQMLNKHGIDSPIDITPDFGICGKRSNEILTWVDKHQITNWVAIDDLDLLTGEHEGTPQPRLRGHFIKCNPLIGLTNELVEQAVSLLNMER